MQKCLFQIFSNIVVKYDGQGDCKNCIPDEKNKHCSRYSPMGINVSGIIIEEKKEEQ